jgi:hypothetical protein
MGMGIGEAKDTPGQPVIHTVGSLGNDLVVFICKQAYMACGTGGRFHVFSHCPGNCGKIPVAAVFTCAVYISIVSTVFFYGFFEVKIQSIPYGGCLTNFL